MDNLNNIENVYFLGIGGIGMSAIARYFLQKGKAVSGYDKTETALTKALQNEGAVIHFDADAHLFPKNPDLVIYTPAVPSSHIAMQYYKANNIKLYKRSELLQQITRNTKTFAVAGTHGKTTTSSLLGHIFRHAQKATTVFLGGISANYNTNYWQGSNAIVVEADEYDRSFHRLAPHAAIITSMDADHLDIYGSVENLHEAFHVFIDKIEDGGLLVHQYNLPIAKRSKSINYISYALNDTNADVFASNIKVVNGTFEFNCHIKGEVLAMAITTGGRYNIENALAATAIAKHYGLSNAEVINGIASFLGVKRRFEYYIKNEEAIFIDDYAHHPTELKATIGAALELYPNRECTVVFQPHLYSRTNDFYKEFAESLSLAPNVILLPIYPARELPMPGVDSNLIAKHITSKVQVLEKETYITWLKENKCNFLLSTGAGDIDELNEAVKQILLTKVNIN